MKTVRGLFARKKNRGMDKNQSTSPVAGLQSLYYCPMKCEGEKTYGIPGNCPVCNMKLVAAKNIRESVVHFRCNI